MAPMLVLALLLAMAVTVRSQSGLCDWCPHVTPRWPSTWELSRSTVVEPCNGSGPIVPASVAEYALVSVDWSNEKSLWVQGRPMDASAPLTATAEALTAANPGQRVMIYRNIVIAYPWFPEVREKLIEPQYEGFFLKFGRPPFANGSFHVPQCDENYSPALCTPFYHSQDQTPGYPTGDGDCPAPHCDCGGVPCGFFLFNHANGTMLRRWLIDVFVMGPTGVGNPAVHGVYLDDRWSNVSSSVDAPDCAFGPIGGPTEVNSGCEADIGLTQAVTTANADNWRATMLELQSRLIDAGAFSWAYFLELNGAPSKAQCSSFFRHNATAVYGRPLMMGLSRPTTNATILRDVATFQALRGAYAWLGHGWQGCSPDGPDPLPPIVQQDFGVPLNNVTEAEPDVFERKWTNALVRVNCTSWEGEIIWN